MGSFLSGAATECMETMNQRRWMESGTVQEES